MTDKMTKAQFSAQCSFIAKNAASWAGDLLSLPELYHEPANPETVKRFTDDIRHHCDLIDAWAAGDEA